MSVLRKVTFFIVQTDLHAVSRNRTYAPRGNLISSQMPIPLGHDRIDVQNVELVTIPVSESIRERRRR